MTEKIKSLYRSFGHATRGVKRVFQTEQSFRIQVIAGAIVVFLTFVLPLAVWELVLVLLLVALVLILELINSVFERLVDSFRPRLHPVVGEIKDIMAATVLIASIFAAIIGIIIFGPYLIALV